MSHVRDLSVYEIVQMIEGQLVRGDSHKRISNIALPAEANEGDVCVIMGNKPLFIECSAGAVVCTDKIADHYHKAGAVIVVQEPAKALHQLLKHFAGAQSGAVQTGIHPSAMIADGVQIGEAVSVGAYSVIETGSVIGNRTLVGAQVTIGKHVRIGTDCVLMDGVRIRDHTVIGDRCVIKPNAVIGSDGFGFQMLNGRWEHTPHLGNVVLGNDVFVGACTTIDRAKIGSTVIEDGVKIDNLVQIAHNVRIGARTVIAAQTGVAGSTVIGKDCVVGGQVGFVGHIEVADGVQVQAQSGVISASKPKAKLYGSPAIDYQQFLRAYAIFTKLPDLYRKWQKVLARLEQNKTQ